MVNAAILFFSIKKPVQYSAGIWLPYILASGIQMLFKIWTTEHCFNKMKFILTFIFRHIALRRDHYECAVLFLMRSARLDVKNENGEIPEDCMKVHKNPKCRLIVKVRKKERRKKVL